ncbi:MAG: hypothetical protein C4B57_01330 [Deltaproteobacteria bacterium]|nr:MAG: hypothetical protein C4B57_01330 [Deltaproteobacteria bacterium]
MRAGRFLPIDAETVKSHRLCAQHFIEPPVAVQSTAVPEKLTILQQINYKDGSAEQSARELDRLFLAGRSRTAIVSINGLSGCLI